MVEVSNKQVLMWSAARHLVLPEEMRCGAAKPAHSQTLVYTKGTLNPCVLSEVAHTVRWSTACQLGSPPYVMRMRPLGVPQLLSNKLAGFYLWNLT